MAIGTGWKRKCPITIPASKVPGTISNYVCSLTEVNFPSEMLDLDGVYGAKSDGGDIRFSSDADGLNELPLDIYSINLDNNPANSTILINVLIGSLSGSVDNTIYVWYANSVATGYGVSDTYGQYNVYPSFIKLYLPLEESGDGTTDEYKDRTENQNHGTGGNGNSANTPTGTPYITGGGQLYDDTSPDCIKVPSSTSLDITGAITMMCYFNKSSSAVGFDTLIYKGNSGGILDYTSYGIFSSSSDNIRAILYDTSNATYFNSVNTLNDDTDYHLAVTWDGTTSGTNLYFYKDGTLWESFSKATGLDSNSSDLWLGAQGGSVNPFKGKQDEVIICNTDLSADYIGTYHNNHSDHSAFAVEGTPVALMNILSNVTFIY